MEDKSIFCTYEINGDKVVVMDTLNLKGIRSKDYNCNYDKRDGKFMRWGKDKKDDPDFSPVPEEFSIDLSTLKKQISFELFSKLLDKMPKSILQINASCIFAYVATEIVKILEHIKSKGIVTSINILGVHKDDLASKLADLCGAINIERQENKNITYDSVKLLLDNKAKCVNINLSVSEGKYAFAKETLEDYLTDDRIKGANILFKFDPDDNILDYDKFKELVEFATKNKIPYGTDNCLCRKISYILKYKGNYNPEIIQSCDAGCFAFKCSVDGKFYPCRNSKELELDILSCNDFIAEIWFNPKIVEFRKNLIEKKHRCPYYQL